MGTWSGERWDGWRDRVYRQAARAAGLAVDARPRDLRGSCASLLIAEGQSVLKVARQLGHSPATCLREYAACSTTSIPRSASILRDSASKL